MDNIFQSEEDFKASVKETIKEWFETEAMPLIEEKLEMVVEVIGDIDIPSEPSDEEKDRDKIDLAIMIKDIIKAELKPVVSILEDGE